MPRPEEIAYTPRFAKNAERVKHFLRIPQNANIVLGVPPFCRIGPVSAAPPTSIQFSGLFAQAGDGAVDHDSQKEYAICATFLPILRLF